jgi:hypothetical protein
MVAPELQQLVDHRGAGSGDDVQRQRARFHPRLLTRTGRP